jgi:hypothetical protein
MHNSTRRPDDGCLFGYSSFRPLQRNGKCRCNGPSLFAQTRRVPSVTVLQPRILGLAGLEPKDCDEIAQRPTSHSAQWRGFFCKSRITLISEDFGQVVRAQEDSFYLWFVQFLITRLSGLDPSATIQRLPLADCVPLAPHIDVAISRANRQPSYRKPISCASLAPYAIESPD